MEFLSSTTIENWSILEEDFATGFVVRLYLLLDSSFNQSYSIKYIIYLF